MKYMDGKGQLLSTTWSCVTKYRPYSTGRGDLQCDTIWLRVLKCVLARVLKMEFRSRSKQYIFICTS